MGAPRSLVLLLLLAPCFLATHLAAGQDEDAIASDAPAASSAGGRKAWASMSAAQSALKAKLLENYDRGSIPPLTEEEREKEKDRESMAVGEDAGNSTFEPITVEVGINFHRILFVDPVNSEVNLLAWMRFIWTDPRLAWDPQEYNGLDKMWFWIESGSGMSETSEIWAPDIDLWNQQQSILNSFTNTYAAVSSDGSIFWSRPGHLNPICKFRGLRAFPFDQLTCVLELGSWAHSGKYVRLALYDGGVSVGGSETSGEAFAEFTLSNVTAEVKVYPPYPSDPLGDWPVVLFEISFLRSWQPYARGYLVGQVIFNVIGFACFWLPVQSGERVSLAITAMLAAVAADLVIVTKLPSASEMTWIQKFGMFSQLYAAFCVLESVLVSYFFYLTSKTLAPRILQCVFRCVGKHRSESREGPSGKQLYKNGAGDDLRRAESGTSGEEGPYGGEYARDADDFANRMEAKCNARWKRVGETIDDISRIFIPASYVIVLGVFLARP